MQHIKDVPIPLILAGDQKSVAFKTNQYSDSVSRYLSVGKLKNFYSYGPRFVHSLNKYSSYTSLAFMIYNNAGQLVLGDADRNSPQYFGKFFENVNLDSPSDWVGDYYIENPSKAPTDEMTRTLEKMKSDGEFSKGSAIFEFENMQCPSSISVGFGRRVPGLNY